MRKVKFIFSAVVAAGVNAGIAIAGVNAAAAADLAVRPYTKAPAMAVEPAYNWSGFYAGLNAGWASIHDNGNPFCVTPAGVLNGIGCNTTNVPGAQIRASGFIGGGQIGYNWQVAHLVYGLETDIQGTSIKGSLNIAGPFNTVGGGTSGPASFTADESMPWFGTVRGRVGYAWDRALLYATGGFAYGGVKVDQNTIYPGLMYPSSVSTTKTGWVAGGGFEWAFSGNWSAKAEGLYYNLGSITTSGGAVPAGSLYVAGKTFDVQGVIARAGVNYKFGAPVVAKY
jgi:outer membrane immunogenic protein